MNPETTSTLRATHTGISRLAIGALGIGGILLWGGVGALDGENAIQVVGIGPQDVLGGMAAMLAVYLLIVGSRIAALTWVILGALGSMLMLGVMVGVTSGNGLQNVAAEARPLAYVGLGLVIGSFAGARLTSSMIVAFASILALSFVMQLMAVTVAPTAPYFVSGVNPGNTITLGLPLVRPAGGFHVLGIGFAVALFRHDLRWRFSALTLISLGVVATQSKTYILILLALITVHALVDQRRPFALRLLRLCAIGTITAGTAIGLAVAVGGPRAISAPVQKFTLVVTNPIMFQAVIGKRGQELGMMWDDLSGSPLRWSLGRGLGRVYRDPGALYSRDDARDRERLAMFGHNYYGWILVKAGIVGIALFLLVSAVPIVAGLRAASSQSAPMIAAMSSILCANLFLGSLENVPAAVAFGLCAGATCSLSKGT